jgi:hypothetical protein
MKRLTIAALGALLLGGCAGTHISKPAVCDGKHRRPANLYGTILPTLPVPLPPSQGTGHSMVTPGPGSGAEALPAPLPPPVLPTPGPEPSPTEPPSTSTNSAAQSAPRTSQRDVAPSFHSC